MKDLEADLVFYSKYFSFRQAGSATSQKADGRQDMAGFEWSCCWYLYTGRLALNEHLCISSYFLICVHSKVSMGTKQSSHLNVIARKIIHLIPDITGQKSFDIYVTFGAAIGYSSGKNNSSLKTPPT